MSDLISREALKRAFEDTVCIEPMPYAFVKQIIDNAPTAFSCNACKNMGNEQECVDCHDYSNYVHYDERPQGEWGKWIITEIQCPTCFGYFETDCYSKEELKKCPNCGADMRGGADMRKGGAE